MTKTKAERIQDVIDALELYFESINASHAYRYGFMRASYRFALEGSELELATMESIIKRGEGKYQPAG